MKTLNEVCSKYKVGDWPDKGDVHSYLEVYEEVLRPYRHTAKNVLEIGLMSGESLRMWTEYFENATVYGMDCTIKPIDGLADLTAVIAEGYNVKIGDASNPAEIEKYFSGIKFDVVIEDANHDLEQQLKIYSILKHYLNPGAIYIIEDIQDIDSTRASFEGLDPEKTISILDRRNIKNRYDDVLVIVQ